MERNTIPEAIRRQTSYKRKVNFSELYQAFLLVPRAALKFLKNKKTKLLDKAFLERLQLAVTEVNACTVCSYAHAQMALNMGMTNEEINSFLSGDDAFQKPEEARAICFAQHYAETRGLPEKQTYNEVVNEYGKEKALLILSSIQIMMAANLLGLPISALKSRIAGKPYTNSSLGYEIGMIIVLIILLPFIIVHAFLRWLIGKPNINTK